MFRLRASPTPASSALPVVRSADARAFFLATAAITVGILIWADLLGMQADTSGLTSIFFWLFITQDYSAAMCLLVILVCAVFVPGRMTFRPLLQWIGQHPGRFAVGGGLLLCLGSLFIYRNHPLSMDEYSQFFQSQVFAAGRLSGQFPPSLLDWLIPQGFQNYFLTVSESTGQVSSGYWPSFALLLTPFTWLGIPWACNPVLSALTLIVIHRLAMSLFEDRQIAGLAVLLTAASPAFFANGISYYTMPAHLLANALYALLLIKPSVKKTFAAGVVGSVALTLHNPVPHLLFALPWLVWTATRPGGLRLFASLGAGYVPLCILLGVGWFWFSTSLAHQTTNAAVVGDIQLDALGKIGSIFSLPSDTLLLARLVGLAKVWLWAVPGLLLLAGMGVWKQRYDLRCWLLVVSALMTLAGYLFVPVDQGHGWGFRYFHSAWMALPLLAAGALARTAETQNRARRFEDDETRTIVVGCAVLTLIVGVGFRGVQMSEFMSEHLQQAPAPAKDMSNVVLVDPTYSFYGQDLVQNDPFLRGMVIRMMSHGADANEKMMHRYFPGYARSATNAYGEVWTREPTRLR